MQDMLSLHSYYDAQATIRYYGRLPDDIKQEAKHVSGLLQFGRLSDDDESSDVSAPDQPPVIPSDAPFDLSQWSQPPHVELANLFLRDAAEDQSNLGAVYRFTKRYGYVSGWVDRTGEYSFVKPFRVDVTDLGLIQDSIRSAWEGDQTAIAELEEGLFPQVRLKISEGEIELGVSDLWTLIRILLLRDIAEKRTRVCKGPDCQTPYFLQARKGQMFCSHRCARLASVRSFRARQKSKKSSNSRKRGGRKGK
jgi:hypothetical protein